jgi:hypothetical protein
LTLGLLSRSWRLTEPNSAANSTPAREKSSAGLCGSALLATYRECGYVNEGGDQYFGGCGPLLAETRLAPQGTVAWSWLFSGDLVGYTRLSSELDPEEEGSDPDRAQRMRHQAYSAARESA